MDPKTREKLKEETFLRKFAMETFTFSQLIIHSSTADSHPPDL